MEKFKVYKLKEFLELQPTDDDCEASYRRGFDQGSFVAVEACLKHKHNISKINKWRELVHQWRWNRKKGMVLPPEIE